MACKPSTIWLLVDVLFYAACLALGVTMALSQISPKPRFISCTDPDLRHPFTGDTINLGVVILTCVLLPAVMIFLVELLTPSGKPSSTSDAPGGRKVLVMPAFKRTLPLFADILVGMLQIFVVVEVLKVMTAQPRPHFWDTCGSETRRRVCPGNERVQIELGLCSNPSRYIMGDAAKSFPSGHSCFSMFAAVYLAVYLHRRLAPRSEGTWTCASVSRNWLSLPWFAWAVVISCSRISDNRHHWWDVLGGAFLGALAAIFTIVVISKNFRSSGRSRRTSGDLELNYNAVQHTEG